MGGRGGSSHRNSSGIMGRMPNRPGFLRFGSQSAAAIWHEANSFSWDQWTRMLSDAERQGIQWYTGSWYSAMNTDLREGTPSSADVQRLIDGATSGLAKWKAAQDMVTFRGANLHWTANLLGGTEAQMSDAAFLRGRIGKTVTDKGFMSTGTHEDSAWYADVKYTIFTRKGVQGMYVDPISMNKGEYEFLFNRDTEFKVHMIRTNSSGQIIELVLEAKKSKK